MASVILLELPAADVTKLKATPASHLVAPRNLFDPIPAGRAFLEILALYELLKSGFSLFRVTAVAELLTGLSFVERCPAIQTVVLFAQLTFEFFISLGIKDEEEGAVSCRTGRHVPLRRSCLLKRKSLIFLEVIN
jgi:hypothetical protein